MIALLRVTTSCTPGTFPGITKARKLRYAFPAGLAVPTLPAGVSPAFQALISCVVAPHAPAPTNIICAFPASISLSPVSTFTTRLTRWWLSIPVICPRRKPAPSAMCSVAAGQRRWLLRQYRAPGWRGCFRGCCFRGCCCRGCCFRDYCFRKQHRSGQHNR
ncbi:MAG: hypothetical protein LUE99_17490 [Bacteroides sp.]|nr:hypothetical protein [Bacteroides sp.]